MRNGLHNHRRAAAKLFVGTLLAALPLLAQAQTKYTQVPGKASVKIDGTSTFHDWEMEGHQIAGVFLLPAGVEIDQAGGKITGLQDGKLPVEAHAHITIATITSKAEHLADTMNNLMQEHMKAADFPAIFYTAKSLVLSNAAPGKPFSFTATGDLGIAGVTNTVTFPITIEQVDATHLKIDGVAPLKMTDFKIDPPAPHPLGMTTMKCGDDIKITIDWLLQKR